MAKLGPYVHGFESVMSILLLSVGLLSLMSISYRAGVTLPRVSLRSIDVLVTSKHSHYERRAVSNVLLVAGNGSHEDLPVLDPHTALETDRRQPHDLSAARALLQQHNSP